MTDKADSDRDKALAGAAAATEIVDGMLVGLGTGSTATHAIAAIGVRVSQGLRVRAVATSRASEALARQLGITMLEFADVPRLDLTIDGADEIDAGFHAIKGGGGAMLREKVVAAASDRMVVVVDGSKRVDRLGARAPLPVEILPFARASVLTRLAERGPATLRRDTDGAPFVTDNGNMIADCRFDLDDPADVAAWLGGIAGMLGHGLFLDEIRAAYFAEDGNVSRLERGHYSG